MRKSLLVAAALCAAALSIVAGFANAAPKATITAALVSDIGKFSDRGFNQNQLLGLNKAKSSLGVKTVALQSNSVSDYIPNLTSAVRQHADIVIAAGFLLANSVATMAKKPGSQVQSELAEAVLVMRQFPRLVLLHPRIRRRSVPCAEVYASL